MKKIQLNIILILSVILLIACENKNYTPKPKAYPRIYFPEKENFVQYQNAECPYTFQYPNYARIQIENKEKPCWFNIYFKDFNATIYMSYKSIGKDISMEKVLEDAHKLTYAHTKKADYIDEAIIKNKNGVKGQLAEVGGNVATNVQFYLSDDEKNYIRGALYFESAPNIDSVQPMVDFIKKDMLHIFETFEWRNKQ